MKPEASFRMKKSIKTLIRNTSDKTKRTLLKRVMIDAQLTREQSGWVIFKD